MQVAAWSSGKDKKTLGVRVGMQNRNRYFAPSWEKIAVEIDGLFYFFSLTAGFWEKCPEFRDKGKPVIREWLLRHFSIDWPRSHPPRFTLQHLEENRFRLIR